MGIWGQDWASYQSETPPTGGLSFFFTKVSQGLGYVNPKWQAQYAHGVAAGLVPGKYHYPDMRNSAASEADYFLAHARVQPGDVLALDWEGYDQLNLSVPRAKQALFKDAFLHYLKARAPHNPVGMYVNVDYWRNVDTTGFYGDFLWIATADRAAGDPGISAPWLFHQYSAAGVDRDFCHLGSTAELRSWALSFATPKPPPAPTPPPPPFVRPSKEQDMIIVQVDRKTVPTTTPPTAWPGDFLLADGKLSYVPTVADVKAFQAAGVAGPVVISWEMYQSLLAGK